MPSAIQASSSLIERALEGLQDERLACLARLKAVMAATGNECEIEGYLRRIENINAALVRLAATRIVH